MSPLLRGHFLRELLPQRQTNKSKKENHKKKTAAISTTTAKKKQKIYVICIYLILEQDHKIIS